MNGLHPFLFTLLLCCSAVAASDNWPVVELVEASDIIIEGRLEPVFEPASFGLFQFHPAQTIKGSQPTQGTCYVMTPKPSFHEGPNNIGPVPLFSTHVLFLQEAQATKDELAEAPSLKKATRVYRLKFGAQGILTTGIKVPADQKALFLKHFPQGMTEAWQQKTLSRCNINRYLRGTYEMTDAREAITIAKDLIIALARVTSEPSLLQDLLARHKDSKLMREVNRDLSELSRQR